MKFYKLTITAYDYWFTCDRDGFATITKYFTTKEKAEEWIAKNPKYIYRGFDDNQTEAEKDYQMPTFRIEEIEAE